MNDTGNHTCLLPSLCTTPPSNTLFKIILENCGKVQKPEVKKCTWTEIKNQ